MATVEADYHAGDTPEFRGMWFATSQLPGQTDQHPSTIALAVRPPSTVTHYVNYLKGPWTATVW